RAGADGFDVPREAIAVALAGRDGPVRRDHEDPRLGRAAGGPEPLELSREAFVELEWAGRPLRTSSGRHDRDREILGDRLSPALERLGLGPRGRETKLGEREGARVFGPRGPIEARADVDLHGPR